MRSPTHYRRGSTLLEGSINEFILTIYTVRIQGKITEGYWRNITADREPVPSQSSERNWSWDAAENRRPEWKESRLCWSSTMLLLADQSAFMLKWQIPFNKHRTKPSIHEEIFILIRRLEREKWNQCAIIIFTDVWLTIFKETWHQ